MKLRRLLVQIHLYGGLLAGLLVSLTGVTGSLLVFGHELDGQLYPHLLHSRAGSSGARMISPDVVFAAVRDAYPSFPVRGILPPRERGATYEVRLKGERRAYVDPYSGAVLGLRSATDHPLGLLFALHTELLNSERGKNVVGVGGLLLVLLGASGVFIWWPGRGQIRRGFTVQGPRARHGAFTTCTA